MSLEAENNSVRSPSPYIITPQRSPTSAGIADDLFKTPRINKELLDSSGWTPIFAEDYALFNATLGRFTNNQATFDTFSPRLNPHSGHKRQHSSTETLRLDIAGSSKGGQSPTSPGIAGHPGRPSPPTIRSAVLRAGSDNPAERTPKKAGQVVQETFTGQTATPPNSRHKHAKRTSEAGIESKMQNEQDFFSQSGTMDGGYDLSFGTPTNVDLFSFPMSGPATAPAYMNGKSFWDPSSNMGDMSMDFSGDAFAASGGWTQSTDIFHQQEPNTQAVDQNNAHSVRKPRPLLAKPPASSMPPVQSGVTFDFGMTSLSEDPFPMPSTTGAVNPNHIFSFPNMTPPLPSNNFQPSLGQSSSQHATQLRLELQSTINVHRPRSSQSKRPESSHRPRPISPLKSTRPDVHRSTSDNLKRPPALKPAAPLSNEVQPPSNFAGKGRYSSGTGNGNSNVSDRLSPTKQGGRTNLQAIPEVKLFNPRTAVTFSIDANGRARTETTVIMERGDSAGPPRGRSASRPSAESASPISGSSTDEEAVVIPNRNSSFAHKDKNREMPKMARFDTHVKQYPRPGSRKLSAGNVRALSKATLALNEESDDHEVVGTARRSGDASKALRRVMENRRRSISGITSMPPSSSVSTVRIQSTRTGNGDGRDRDRERHYRRQSYVSSSYSASTPSTVTDLDMDVEMMGCDTPSTVASESTRCVCHRKEKSDDEFMIQCESCEHWQHSTCVKIDPRELPKVYICAFCAQTPNMRGGRVRDKQTVIPDRNGPLERKSFH